MMHKILIVESNTPELLAQAKANGIPRSSALYARSLQMVSPDLEISVVTP